MKNQKLCVVIQRLPLVNSLRPLIECITQQLNLFVISQQKTSIIQDIGQAPFLSGVQVLLSSLCGCWQNSVSFSYRIEMTVFLLTVRCGHCQLLKSSHSSYHRTYNRSFHIMATYCFKASRTIYSSSLLQ